MSNYTPSAEELVLAAVNIPEAEARRGIAKIKADALREAGQGMRAQVERATEYQRFTEHELIEHGVEHVLNEYADLIEGAIK